MSENQKTRWIIRGTGHWIMIAAVWILTLLAGDRLMQAVRGEESWLEAIGGIAFSFFFGLVALRAKRGQD